jgi:ribonuclease P protein component
MTRLWRVRDRATFAALRRDGVRRRAGALTVTRLDPAAGGSAVLPAVAFAIGTKVGTAAVRNRIRRRIRAAIAEIDPRPGTYLIVASTGARDASYQDLRASLAEAMA